MGSRHASSQGEAFLVAFADAVRDMEQGLNVTVEWSFHTTPRRGVVCVHGVAYCTPQGATGPMKAGSIEGEYPNSTAGSLEAFLYSLAFKLAGMVHMWVQHEKEAQRGARA